MIHDILFKATIPGACINAIQTAEESKRQNKRKGHTRHPGDKPRGTQASLRPKFWSELVSRIGRWKQSGLPQGPAE